MAARKKPPAIVQKPKFGTIYEERSYTKAEKRHVITIDACALFDLLLNSGYIVPEMKAAVECTVPHSGLSGGEKFDLTDDCPITITWTDVEEYES
jgi:hypothetical protein